MVAENTKAKAVQPKITPIQLILFALLTGWAIITNLNQFKGLNIGWQMGIQIAFYVAIMLTAGQRGSVLSLVRSFIEIIGSKDTDENKVVRLQNLVVAICQELGIFYEKELAKLQGYINGTISTSEVESLQAKIAELEAQLEGINLT